METKLHVTSDIWLKRNRAIMRNLTIGFIITNLAWIILFANRVYRVIQLEKQNRVLVNNAACDSATIKGLKKDITILSDQVVDTWQQLKNKPKPR